MYPKNTYYTAERGGSSSHCHSLSKTYTLKLSLLCRHACIRPTHTYTQAKAGRIREEYTVHVLLSSTTHQFTIFREKSLWDLRYVYFILLYALLYWSWLVVVVACLLVCFTRVSLWLDLVACCSCWKVAKQNRWFR